MERSQRQIVEPDLFVIPFMRITGVEFRKVPKWFNRIRVKSGQKVVSWFDHYGRMRERPDVLVVEPYNPLRSLDFAELASFCDEHGLDYIVFPTSAYSPSQTLHVRIWPREAEIPDF